MRTRTVIGMLLLAGLAWAVALAEEPPAALANGRYPLRAAAVARALQTAGVAVETTQVGLPGVLTAAVAMPALRVSGAESRGNGELMVRLRCEAAAECLPFFAEVKMGGRAEAIAAAERLRGSREMVPAVATEAVERGATVHGEHGGGVAVGARVRLELADAQMRIVLPGIAVDAGTPGAEVRVASLDRRQTYRGVVVNATTVKGGVE